MTARCTMRRSSRLRSIPKTSYRPIEAAIRWSGLLKHERQILRVRARTTTIASNAYSRWPEFQLNFDRIIDAIRNSELPASIEGEAKDTVIRLDHPALAIRHVDLKTWMTRFYPECRPSFLFGSLARSLKPAISVEAVHALLIEREALKVQLEQLQAHDRTRSVRAVSTAARASPRVPSLDTRGETTHLNILGCLLKLMLGSSPSGQPYSAFRSQESIINAMIAENGDRLGISERTLEAKFAAARRALNR